MSVVVVTIVRAHFLSKPEHKPVMDQRVRATALYLMARQHLPLERIKEAASELLGLNCSTGLLDNAYNQCAKDLDTFIDEVTSQLSEAEVVSHLTTISRHGVVNGYQESRYFVP